MLKKEILFSNVKLIFIRKNEKTAITDLQAIVTAPNGSESSPITMARVANGYYVATYSPNYLGYHFWRVFSLQNSILQAGGDFFVVNDWDNTFIANKKIYVGKVIGSSVDASKIHCNLFNANSNETVKILKITLNSNVAKAVTGHNVGFQLKRTSTQGVGIFSIISKLDTSSSGLTNINCVSEFSTAPLLISGQELAGANVDTEEARTGLAVSIFKYQELGNPIILRPSEGVCIQQDDYSSNGKINIFYYFTI